jgi:hypothetical protein
MENSNGFDIKGIVQRTVTWLFRDIIQTISIYSLIASLLFAWIFSYSGSFYDQRFLYTQEEKMKI